MKQFLRAILWFFWPTTAEMQRRQHGDEKPELGRMRTYRGYTYKIWTVEDKDDDYNDYRHNGYISLEVHVRYPDGQGVYTTSDHKHVASTIDGFIKQAETYIDRMINEANERQKMEQAINNALK